MTDAELLAEARKHLTYDPATGVFSRNGKIVGFKDMNRGGRKHAIKFSLNGKVLLAHRIAWLMVYGRLPTMIDHINGDPFDNRIENLRECTVSQNGLNRGAQSNSSSGFKGVRQSYYNQEIWIAVIKVGGKRFHIGSFRDPRVAAHEYNKAAIRLHGEFACLNPL